MNCKNNGMDELGNLCSTIEPLVNNGTLIEQREPDSTDKDKISLFLWKELLLEYKYLNKVFTNFKNTYKVKDV